MLIKRCACSRIKPSRTHINKSACAHPTRNIMDNANSKQNFTIIAPPPHILYTHCIESTPSNHCINVCFPSENTTHQFQTRNPTHTHTHARPTDPRTPEPALSTPLLCRARICISQHIKHVEFSHLTLECAHTARAHEQRVYVYSHANAISAWLINYLAHILCACKCVCAHMHSSQYTLAQ